MIRRNIDFLAILVLLAGIAVITQTRRAIDSIPINQMASAGRHTCPLVRAVTLLPFFRIR